MCLMYVTINKWCLWKRDNNPNQNTFSHRSAFFPSPPPSVAFSVGDRTILDWPVRIENRNKHSIRRTSNPVLFGDTLTCNCVQVNQIWLMVCVVSCAAKWNKKRECAALACRSSACVHFHLLLHHHHHHRHHRRRRPSTHLSCTKYELKNWLFLHTHTEAEKKRKNKIRARARESPLNSKLTKIHSQAIAVYLRPCAWECRVVVIVLPSPIHHNRVPIYYYTIIPSLAGVFLFKNSYIHFPCSEFGCMPCALIYILARGLC